MIKTHEPRGHIWTHASAFQQTKEYRDVRLEECIAPASRVLVRDEDQDLSNSERSAKQRKIEKCADDFLNGVPLFISSAKPSSQSLKSTIAWNKKSSNEPKFALADFDASEVSQIDSEAWEDVESDAEILERLRLRRHPCVQPDRCKFPPNVESGSPPEAVEAVQAQASCGRSRQLKAAKISSGPSDDALRQAAALRARRVRRANSEAPNVHNNLSIQAQAAVEEEPRSEPSYDAPKRHDHRQISDWLSRRKSPFSVAGEGSHDDTVDELQLSRIETPSAPSRQPNLEPEMISAGPSNGQESRSTETEDEPPKERTFGDKQSFQNASYHTAPEKTDGHLDLSTAQSSNDASISTSVSRRSLPDISKHNTGNETNGRRAKSVGNNRAEQPSTSKVTRSSTLRQAQNKADSSSATSQRTRRGAARSNSEKPGYAIAKPSQNESTPLRYRKGRLRGRDSGVEQESAGAQDWREGKREGPAETPTNLSGAKERLSEQKNPQAVAAVPPILDMSFNHDSSFAPNLNMAIVDEHLNTILPAERVTERKSSTIKKAIRRELRNSRAEISRCASEPPTSSQIQEASSPQPESTDEPASAESLQEKWAGTQFLLNQAQIDLVTSPEKQNPNGDSQGKANPQNNDDRGGEEFTRREALKQLSQEPMPSTQQLLGDFEGWSTVKKPRAAYRSSPLPTPTATEKSGWTAINATEASSSTPGLDLLRNDSMRRRSSLRFSIPPDPSQSSNTSRLQTRQMEPSVAALLSSHITTPVPISDLSNRRQLSLQHSLEISKQVPSAQPTEATLASESFASGPSLSSFQAGQPPSELLCDSLNLSETVDDLTRDLLCMNDLESVLSDV